MNEHLQAFATILALVNPAVCVQIFSNCVGDVSRKEKVGQALKAVVTIGIILLIAALAGTAILDAFGVSLDAFSCAGGGILIWIGASMLRSAEGESKPDSTEPAEASISLTPLVLFAASPGTITGVITVAAAHTKRHLPLTALVGVAATLAVLTVVLLISIRFSTDRRKPSITRRMITSYMGVIVIAMGVQFALSGIKAFLS